MDLDPKLEHAILKIMTGSPEGSVNTREIVESLVGQGWELQTVLDHLVEMYKRKLFDLPGLDEVLRPLGDLLDKRKSDWTMN